MIFNSIRWRLQIWYGLILVAVLAGFGVTAYQLEQGRQFRRIDEELRHRANALANALRPPRDRGPGGPRPFGRPPPEAQLPGERPPPRGPRDDGPREPLHLLTEGFRPPPQFAAWFDESDTNGFYYVVWTFDRKEITRSTNAPPGVTPFSIPRPTISDEVDWPLGSVNAPPRLRRGPPEPQPPAMRGDFREMTTILNPPGAFLLVGRSIAPEKSELRGTALKLAGVGGFILLLGLAGGWWLAARAIRPIKAISATATKIAGGDLSQRINTADTESELGRLADVLNSTFARLDAAFAQQKQFASDAAHELRTPVSVILTQTQTTLNRERGAAEYRETVEACRRAAERMRRLIESLLQLTRLDAGQEPMKRLRVDLAHVAADSVELVRPLAAERGVRLEHDVSPLPCDGDPERLAQVITNLLTNAIQYTPQNREVRIRGEARDGTVIVSVSDTGEGIAPEDLPRVFDRFYRADKSRSSGHAGLGLAISKAIVEAHGGTIEVASEPGKGATFTIRLPGAKSS